MIFGKTFKEKQGYIRSLAGKRKKKFAFWPRQLANGQWVWLQFLYFNHSVWYCNVNERWFYYGLEDIPYLEDVKIETTST